MKHFLLFYELADDYLERREAYRAAHLKLAWEAHERGELLQGGALEPAPDRTGGAVLFFQGGDRSAAENFAKADPYVAEGLVKRWQVREWRTVVGEAAAAPVRP